MYDEAKKPEEIERFKIQEFKGFKIYDTLYCDFWGYGYGEIGFNNKEDCIKTIKYFNDLYNNAIFEDYNAFRYLQKMGHRRKTKKLYYLKNEAEISRYNNKIKINHFINELEAELIGQIVETALHKKQVNIKKGKTINIKTLLNDMEAKIKINIEFIPKEKKERKNK